MNNSDELSIWLFDADGHFRKLADIEADVINLAVVLYGGSIAKAASRLCIGRSTLYRKLERQNDLYRQGLKGEDYRVPSPSAAWVGPQHFPASV